MRAPGSSSRRTGARLKPEERPVYAQRRIAPSVEISFTLPPSTNSLFFNAPGGRRKTAKYRSWRDNAVRDVCFAQGNLGRIAGPCAITIRLPPFSGDIDNRVKPCLDVAVAAGIIADDGQCYVPAHPRVDIDRSADRVRMIFTALAVEPEDAAEIETRAQLNQSPAYIAVALGLSQGQVETVLAGVSRRPRPRRPAPASPWKSRPWNSGSKAASTPSPSLTLCGPKATRSPRPRSSTSSPTR